ncbi:MAG: signal peptidase I [Clostridia bacterium]|nr:signal peptidase I [Clostridia bacterium]
MTKDKKITYFLSALIFAALLSCLFISGEVSSRVTAALILVPSAFAVLYFIKKRSTPSINKRTVLLISAVFALLYVALLYLSGLKFGFLRSRELTVEVFFGNILPIALIIISVEIIRRVILSQRWAFSSALSYLIGITADVLIFSKLVGIEKFTDFMDVVGLHLLPAITGGVLYGYLSKRYGVYPNIAFRLITVLYSYVIPYTPALPDALLSFSKLFVPLLLLLFIDLLFEKKRRFAARRKSKWRFVLTGGAIALMVSTVMIISCQFRFGMLVISTDSMTGELNKGDAIVYESRDGDDPIFVGDVLVFERAGAKTVHRVTKMEKINGSVHYYTKGDANEHEDLGYITDSDIIGKVKFKIANLGYPSIWLRELFDNK